jgi:hypothetical protein
MYLSTPYLAAACCMLVHVTFTARRIEAKKCNGHQKKGRAIFDRIKGKAVYWEGSVLI